MSDELDFILKELEHAISPLLNLYLESIKMKIEQLAEEEREE